MAYWKVKDFQPNEVQERASVLIYADEKGRLKRIVQKDNPGITSAKGRAREAYFIKDMYAYYDDEPKDQAGIPYSESVIDVDEYPRTFKEGDWVHFSDGVTCQILKVYRNLIPSKKGDLPREQIFIQTMFGTNNVFANAPINLLYDRESFSRMRKHLITRTRLTSRESLLVARYIEANFDLVKTYELHYGKPMVSVEAQKYVFAAKLKEAMYSDVGMKLFAEIFCRRFKSNMTFEDWREKIVNSIPDKLTKPFHMDMWLLLGKLEPEVRKRLMEAEGVQEEPKEGAFSIPQTGGVQDAEYQDICKVCGGTKKYKTKTTVNSVEVEVEVECPACKNGSSPVSAVQKRSIELRV